MESPVFLKTRTNRESIVFILSVRMMFILALIAGLIQGCGRLRWRICRAGVMKDRFLRIK